MIGGNLLATFQLKTVIQNEIGEGVKVWTDFKTVKGFLDLSSGNSNYSHKTKSEDSTHMFICDVDSDIRSLDITKCRCLINSRIYEVKFIDDPMELGDHLEITLKLIGVNNA